MANTTVPVAHDPTRYQGRNLVRLLLAMGLPAGLLYLRILLGAIAGFSRTITSAQIAHLTTASNLTLAAFCIVQLLCASYIQKLAPPRFTRTGRALQYVGVVAMCILLSVTGAILFEAFSMNFLLRAGRL